MTKERVRPQRTQREIVAFGIGVAIGVVVGFALGLYTLISGV